MALKIVSPHTLLVASLSMFLSTSPAIASDADPQLTRCLDSERSNRDVAQCYSDHLARLERQIESSYQGVIRKLSSPDLSDLYEPALKAIRSDHAAWKSYKENTCQYYHSDGLGRQAQIYSFPACRSNVLSNRLDELNSFSASLEP